MILFISFIQSMFSSGTSAQTARTSGPRANDPTSPTTQTTDQYTGRTQTQQPPQQEPQQEQPQRSFWGRVWGAVRSTAVVLTATIVTGAVMASGIGIVAGIAIVAGVILASNIGTAIANGGTKEAWKECGANILGDIKSAGIAIVSTLCGMGVARLVTGGAQAAATITAGTRLLGAASAGASGATVSTVIGTADQLHQANQEFAQHIEQIQREEGRTLTQREIANERQRFMEERKLTMAQILRGAAVNIGTGALSGGVGARFQAARQGVQSSLSQGLSATRGQVLRSSIAAEATVLTGIGMGSSVVTHGELTLEESIQHIGSSYAGGYLGNRVNHLMERRAQAARAQQSPPAPRNGSSPPQGRNITEIEIRNELQRGETARYQTTEPHSGSTPQETQTTNNRQTTRTNSSSRLSPKGRVVGDNEIPKEAINRLNYARKRGEVKIELVENPPLEFIPHADVIEILNPNTGQSQRQTTIRISDLSQLSYELLRHTNRNNLVRLPEGNLNTGTVNRNDLRRYLAERALQELTVRAPKERQIQESTILGVNLVKQMQQLVNAGKYKEAIKYANKHGVGNDYRRSYIIDARESLASNGQRIIQRGNLQTVKLGDKLIPIINKGVDFKNLQKLTQAIELLEQCGWLKENYEALSSIRSIIIQPRTGSFLGKAGYFGHPILVIENTSIPELIALTLVHERQHHITRLTGNYKSMGDFYNEKMDGVIKHSWSKQGSTFSFLNELESYHKESQLTLQFFKKNTYDSRNRRMLVKDLIHNQVEARNVIKLIKENKQHLNNEGRQWLQDLELRWNRLALNSDVTLFGLLKSTDSPTRHSAYLLLSDFYTLSPATSLKEKAVYSHLFNQFISQETNWFTFYRLARNSTLAPEMRQSTLARFQSPEIQNQLMDTIRYQMSKPNKTLAYERISLGYELTTNSQRNQYLNLFRGHIAQETNIQLLNNLLNSPYINSDLKSTIRNRIGQLTEPVRIPTTTAL